MLQNTSQEHKAQFDTGTKYNSTNYKETTSYEQNTKSSLQPPLTVVNTPHPAYHLFVGLVALPAPSPTHYHTPPATQYLTTHQTTVPLYPNPPPLHSIPYATSNICTRTTNTLSYFSLHRYPTSIPHPTPQYPGWVPANDTKGHNCK